MKALKMAALIVAVCVVTAGANLIQTAPRSAAEKRNPFEGDEYADRAGGKLYARECASCHGDNREGRRKAPPLNRADVRTAPSGTLFWILRNGSSHRAMPSFAHLPEAQRWQIITFLQQDVPRK